MIQSKIDDIVKQIEQVRDLSELNEIGEAMVRHRELLNARKRGANLSVFSVGMRVRFGNKVKPLYLRGIGATIVKLGGDKVTVKVDSGLAGRFSGQEVRIDVAALEVERK